ncbi:hypothetical protein J8273_1058 [Carpediemonas membranifera]|uniref:Uncharacterized protein n=1 Tax=Carpediemonas membranifera TaxID=201153 RepID=A0A8J6E240_9EUKA|nr:hypothetical protein J8273_1058 [Carpediemonas membranifera]|eukprot:KAG9397149.1 hypothetical protein J8273_1058 [Carpediemonas membranifera]
MHAFLAKKIAMPNGHLTSVDWCKSGHLAVGGHDLLRVLLLDNVDSGPKLIMNQQLDIRGAVISDIHWNHDKIALTSADENGQIFVWQLDNAGTGFEISMESKRETKDGVVPIAGMEWTANGDRVAIAYTDGNVVMGTAEGARTMSAQTGIYLKGIAISPDTKTVLLVDTSDNIHIMDAVVKPVARLNLPAAIGQPTSSIVAVRWNSLKQLLVVWASGRLQISRDLADSDPVIVDAGLAVVAAEWSPTCELFALLGVPESGSHASILFFNGAGQHQQTLNIAVASPSDATDLTWSEDGRRLAISVGKHVYFAYVHLSIEHGYMSDDGVLVYTYQQPGRKEDLLAFWTPETGDVTVKGITSLRKIKCTSDHTLVMCALDADTENAVVLFNSLGAPIDTLKLPCSPDCMAASSTICAVTLGQDVIVWKYRADADAETSAKPVIQEDPRVSMWAISDPATVHTALAPEHAHPVGSDPIVAVALTDSVLAVGQRSGHTSLYSLSSDTGTPGLIGRVALTGTNKGGATTPTRPSRFEINCNGTLLACIDANSVLTVFKIRPASDPVLTPLLAADGTPFQRQDAWDFLWSDTDPGMMAVCEKNRLIIVQDTQPEEPLESPASLCSLRDMVATGVDLDAVKALPDDPPRDAVVKFEAKSLRDMRGIMANGSLVDVSDFVQKHPHPKLWELHAELALTKLDFTVANTAFTRARSFNGLQLVRHLKDIADTEVQKAEVLVHLKQFDDAEAAFIRANRPDLAISMRRKMGDFIRLRSLLKTSKVGDGGLATIAEAQVGDYYEGRGQWARAVKHYETAGDYGRMADMLLRMEMYEDAAALIDMLEASSPVLTRIGHVMLSVGLIDEAARAFLRQGNRSVAIDACVTMNRWPKAVEIAGNDPALVEKVREPLVSYCSTLTAKGRVMDAASLLSRCAFHTEAHKALNEAGTRLIRQDVPRVAGTKLSAPPLLGRLVLAKRIFVQAAIEAMLARTRALQTSTRGLKDQVQGMDQWAPAFGVHFLLLAQTLITKGRDYYHFALIAAERASLYSQLTDGLVTKSTEALAALLLGDQGAASDSMSALETADRASESLRTEYTKLSLRLFRSGVKDRERTPWTCKQCKTVHSEPAAACSQCGAVVPVCMASAQVIDDKALTDVCGRCRQSTMQGMAPRNANGTPYCALCHAMFMKL